jgi:hypothetical protein
VTSQQTPVAEVREAQARTPPFFVEIEERVFKKLMNIATKEELSINELATVLLRHFLLLHRTEAKRVIDTIKRNHQCHV